MASFCKPEIGICISLLVSKLVLLVEFHEVGCCIECVSLIALTVLNDGMLAVSAQCGCCHHSIMCIDIYALQFVLFHLCSPYILAGIFYGHLYQWYVYMKFWIIVIQFYIWYWMVVDIAWYIYSLEFMVYILVGGLILLFMYHHLVCIFYSPCSVYPCGICLHSVLFI